MEKIKGKKKLLLYGCSGLGVNMLTLMIGTYLCSGLLIGGFDEHLTEWTYIGKDLVIAAVWSVMVLVAKVLDGIIDIPLASLADKISNKFGRRKTAILIGFCAMITAFLLFLIPLNKEATLLNTIWFGVILCTFYSFYTLTMLTYYATFAEVCETENDVLFLSNVKSVCDVVYFILGYALIPVFIGMNINIRIVSLIFLPLSLTMMIPMFMLKEGGAVNTADGAPAENEDRLTLGSALKCSVKNWSFMYWMFTISVMTVGLQLFLGGINELFSSTGLSMTVVMASAFVPVPFTLILYNHIVKKKGLGFGYRYILSIFTVGMLVMLICCLLHEKVTEGQLTAIAIVGGLFVSFAIGAFFSITYTVPSHLAQREKERTGKSVSPMYFAVQGLFEGVAAGIGTGLILVQLKDHNAILWLPVIVAVCCVIAFGMSFAFPKEISQMGKETKESNK
ncbi:MAG: MFS transporter [Clostridia bacterium]|nr:MFS transporter [Clostridia bacterium]